MKYPDANRRRWCVGLALIGVTALAQATSVSVNPVRVTLEDGRAIETIALRNKGDDPIVLQAVAMDWSVEDNQDRYSETDALVVTPPVFAVEPGESQVVRLGLEKPVADRSERAFRVFFEQSPVAAPTDDGGQGKASRIRLNLRIGIPVFVGPTQEGSREIGWRAERQANGVLTVVGENLGNVHARITHLAVLDRDGAVLAESERLTYLLPATNRAWNLELPEQAADGPYRLRVRSQHGVVETQLHPG